LVFILAFLIHCLDLSAESLVGCLEKILSPLVFNPLQSTFEPLDLVLSQEQMIQINRLLLIYIQLDFRKGSLGQVAPLLFHFNQRLLESLSKDGQRLSFVEGAAICSKFLTKLLQQSWRDFSFVSKIACKKIDI
jgi:hypothetical protein